MHDCIAIIPARSGSKGISNKNIRPFNGVPLVVRTINAASQAKLVTKVVVSTDSHEYADICRKAGAEVVIRPEEMASDTATSESALIHALKEVKNRTGNLPFWTVFLQCTSPFTRSNDIDSLINKVVESNADTGFSAVESHRFLWRINNDGGAEAVNHEKYKRLLRQAREPEFLENGAIYVLKTDDFLVYRHRFFGKTVLMALPEYHAVEIDSELDWIIAEQLELKIRERTKSGLMNSPRLVVFDFDGVLTDNRVILMQDGKEAVCCSRSDGMAISWLRKSGIQTFILSKERNPVVMARASKLGIPAYQGVDRKADFLVEWCHKNNMDLQEVLYVGNDVNDLECFNIVGQSAAVADAVPEVLKEASIQLNKTGGNGAVREIVELILKFKSIKPY